MPTDVKRLSVSEEEPSYLSAVGQKKSQIVSLLSHQSPPD